MAQHEPGNWDAGAKEIARWAPADLDEMLVDLNDLRSALARALVRASAPGGAGQTPPGPQKLKVRDWDGSIADAIALLGLQRDEIDRRDLVGILKRGALLHTDIGVVAAEAASSQDVGHRLPGTSVHCGFAMALLDSIGRESEGDRFVHAWYRAVAGLLQLHREVAAAPQLLELAVSMFPDDAYLLASAGSVHELLASPIVQAGSYFRDSGLSADVGSEASNLAKAERFFRRALDRDPAAAEVRVRLARVLGRQGRHREAIEALRLVRPDEDEPFVRYFTWLFLGDEEQAAGDPDAARDAYSHALTVFPSAQSGWLALSHLARRVGDRAGAIDAMERALTSPSSARGDERYDPWGEYSAGQGRATPELLSELRRPFVRATSPSTERSR